MNPIVETKVKWLPRNAASGSVSCIVLGIVRNKTFYILFIGDNKALLRWPHLNKAEYRDRRL